jgi:hypothetical protein
MTTEETARTSRWDGLAADAPPAARAAQRDCLTTGGCRLTLPAADHRILTHPSEPVARSCGWAGASARHTREPSADITGVRMVDDVTPRGIPSACCSLDQCAERGPVKPREHVPNESGVIRVRRIGRSEQRPKWKRDCLYRGRAGPVVESGIRDDELFCPYLLRRHEADDHLAFPARQIRIALSAGDICVSHRSSACARAWVSSPGSSCGRTPSSCLRSAITTCAQLTGRQGDAVRWVMTTRLSSIGKPWKRPSNFGARRKSTPSTFSSAGQRSGFTWRSTSAAE